MVAANAWGWSVITFLFFAVVVPFLMGGMLYVIAGVMKGVASALQQFIAYMREVGFYPLMPFFLLFIFVGWVIRYKTPETPGYMDKLTRAAMWIAGWWWLGLFPTLILCDFLYTHLITLWLFGGDPYRDPYSYDR